MRGSPYSPPDIPFGRVQEVIYDTVRYLMRWLYNDELQHAGTAQ